MLGIRIAKWLIEELVHNKWVGCECLVDVGPSCCCRCHIVYLSCAMPVTLRVGSKHADDCLATDCVDVFFQLLQRAGIGSSRDVNRQPNCSKAKCGNICDHGL